METTLLRWFGSEDLDYTVTHHFLYLEQIEELLGQNPYGGPEPDWKPAFKEQVKLGPNFSPHPSSARSQ